MIFINRRGVYALEGVQMHWKMVKEAKQGFLLIFNKLSNSQAIFMVIFQPEGGNMYIRGYLTCF